MPRCARSLSLCVLALLAACQRVSFVGSIQCRDSADCTPPATICGPDERCIPGCAANPLACGGGTSCDMGSGECTQGGACSSDADCMPPDLVCRISTHSCVGGCTATLSCPAGLSCNPQTGHCCQPGQADCPTPADGGASCNADLECVGFPANICQGGQCVPGCTSGMTCASGLTCDTATGHCTPGSCARDLDCDPGSYCTQSGSCSVLAFGGPSRCAGGTYVYYDCATKSSPRLFASCAGSPGPGGCPYCIEGSCYHPGLCSSASDCHRGDACQGGLCRVQPTECPTTVGIAEIIARTFAAGKEVCVRDTVTAVDDGYDGNQEVRLGTSPYLYLEIEPMYRASGVATPSVGQRVTVHGTVRWDSGHDDYEMLPVDWVGP
jgi:hypothetical protein